MRRVYVGMDLGSKQCAAVAINGKGEMRGLANNGSPTSAGYRDGPTKATTFQEGRFGQGPVKFYRPLLQQQP